MLQMRKCIACLLAAAVLILPSVVMAADAEVEQLKRDIEDLRKQLRNVSTTHTTTVSSGCDKCLDSKYGPNAVVTTKNGKLTIGGLVQAWYYTFQHESRAMFDGAGAGGGAGVVDSNETQQVGGFRVRRT